MMRLRSATGVLCLAAVCLLAGQAEGSTPFQAPNATFLIDGGIFSDGQSNNIGPAAIQVLDEFWILGACPSESDPDDYSRCDELRLGLTLYADATCTSSSEIYSAPGEDGGGLVKGALRTIQNDGRYCADLSFRPLDDALWNHWAASFPGGAWADESVKDRWYDRAHLALAIIYDMPQTSDYIDDQRVKESLRAACVLHEGDQANGVPSMPTWVMLARQFHHEAVPFAKLLAAAGGTGTCCLAESGESCDPHQTPLDVCAHLAEVDEGGVRDGLRSGRYICAGGEEVYSTGAMDFANASTDSGTLPQIRCHLVGDSQGDNCNHSRRQPTNILGIMACVRQLPRGVSGDEAEIHYCPYDSLNCEVLTEDNGGIEFLDDEKTLFMITGIDESGRDRCKTMTGRMAEIDIFTCQSHGEPCEVPGKYGRCRLGEIVCQGAREVCQPLYGPMPEICNGLDNDCDGFIDNLSSTTATTEGLPTSARHLACYGQDVCRCQNGPEQHGGHDLESYLATWTGKCECVAALADDGLSAQATASAPQ
ncbi:MAG: hypothetical protein ACNA8W_15105, partial [Bradymonadaceae bacterium]